MLSSPVFAEACKHHNAFRLLGIGMAIWCAAVIGCAAAPTFGALLFCRALVGVGEASFVALAAPFIDDYAPPQAKTRWLAIFYLCIPVGVAAGFIFGAKALLRPAPAPRLLSRPACCSACCTSRLAAAQSLNCPCCAVL